MRFGLTAEGLRAPGSSRTGEETERPVRPNPSLLAVGVKLTGNTNQGEWRADLSLSPNSFRHSCSRAPSSSPLFGLPYSWFSDIPGCFLLGETEEFTILNFVWFCFSTQNFMKVLLDLFWYLTRGKLGHAMLSGWERDIQKVKGYFLLCT